MRIARARHPTICGPVLAAAPGWRRRRGGDHGAGAGAGLTAAEGARGVPAADPGMRTGARWRRPARSGCSSAFVRRCGRGSTGSAGWDGPIRGSMAGACRRCGRYGERWGTSRNRPECARPAWRGRRSRGRRTNPRSSTRVRGGVRRVVRRPAGPLNARAD